MTPIEKEHANDVKIAVLQTTNQHIHETLHRIENKMDEGFKKVDTRIDKIDNRLWQIIFLMSSSILAAILGKIMHWI
jgi:UDP-N-acetylglucosamine 2-epimerase